MGAGDLLNIEKPTVNSESTGRLTFSWKDNSNKGSARATDQSFAALYFEELKKWETRKEGPQRNTNSFRQMYLHSAARQYIPMGFYLLMLSL